MTLAPPMPATHNLRDLGGISTEDGGRVRSGLVYRSGVMTGLTPADRAAFAELGIAAIVDLRSTKERLREPIDWHVGMPIAYHAREYALSIGSLSELIASGATSEAAMAELMTDAYRTLPYEQAESYRTLFALLLDGKVPLIFNCTAGKDRTGIAAALLLTVLGVGREAIERDFILTDRVIGRLSAMLLADPHFGDMREVPPDHVRPLLRADPAYLAAMFAELARREGGVMAYYERVLGIGAREAAALRALLVA